MKEKFLYSCDDKIFFEFYCLFDEKINCMWINAREVYHLLNYLNKTRCLDCCLPDTNLPECFTLEKRRDFFSQYYCKTIDKVFCDYDDKNRIKDLPNTKKFIEIKQVYKYYENLKTENLSKKKCCRLFFEINAKHFLAWIEDVFLYLNCKYRISSFIISPTGAAALADENLEKSKIFFDKTVKNYCFIATNEIYAEKNLYILHFTESLEKSMKKINRFRMQNEKFYVIQCNLLKNKNEIDFVKVQTKKFKLKDVIYYLSNAELKKISTLLCDSSTGKNSLETSTTTIYDDNNFTENLYEILT